MSLVTLPIEVLWMVVKLGELNTDELKCLRQCHPSLSRAFAPMLLQNLKLRAIHFRYANKFAKNGTGLTKKIKTLALGNISEDFKGLPRTITITTSNHNYMSPGFNEDAVKCFLSGFPNLEWLKLEFDVYLMRHYVAKFLALLKECWPENSKTKLYLSLTRLQSPYFNLLDDLPTCVNDLRLAGWVDPHHKRHSIEHIKLKEAIQSAVKRSPNLTSLSVNFKHMSINSFLDTSNPSSSSHLEAINNEGCKDGLQYHFATGLKNLKELYIEWYRHDDEQWSSREIKKPLSPFTKFQEIGTKLTCLRTQMLDNSLLDYLVYAKDSLQSLDIEVQGVNAFRHTNNVQIINSLCHKFWKSVFPHIQHNIRHLRLVPFSDEDVKDMRCWSRPVNHASFLPSVNSWSISELLSNAKDTNMRNLESLSMFLFYSKDTFDRLMAKIEECPNLKKIKLCILTGPKPPRGFVGSGDTEAVYAEIEHVEHGSRKIEYDVEMEVSLWGYCDPWWSYHPTRTVKEYSWGDLGWEGRRGRKKE